MITKELYGVDGQIVTVDDKDTVAKSSFNDETLHGRYYVKFHNSRMVNSKATTFHRTKADAKYRQVTKQAFDFYIKFISGKGETFLREAERAI